MVGYVAGVPWIGAAESGDLLLHWPQVTREVVSLRATSLRWRTFYRMNADSRGEAGSFRWPTEVLKGLRLEGDDVGLTALTVLSAQGGDVRILLPLSVGRDEADTSYANPTIILMGDADLEEIQMAAYPLSRSRWSRPLSPIRSGVFVAGRPILDFHSTACRTGYTASCFSALAT